MNNKWPITGYAMHTAAGTECNFNYERNIGFTESKNSDWTNCVNQNNIQNVCEIIKKTIDRAIHNARLDISSDYIISLIIASNFFENTFWEQDEMKTMKDENYITTYLKDIYPINGVIVCNSTACSSGGSAIVTACQILDDNKTDVVIVLGYDIESEIPKNGMRRVGALSKDKIAPFSLGRTGTDLADGIGVMIIESSETVKARSATVHASIVGYGVNSDAYNITSPEPSGTALLKAMKGAINMAGIPINEVDYINAHGSGTKLNDIIETKVTKELFKEHAYELYINSSKSMIGHTLGAAGVIEVIITIMQMDQGIIHPTANFLGNDIECDLNYCFEEKIDCYIKYAISSSIGFGGTNVCILLEGGRSYAEKCCYN
ncbi:TPA: beta-ketoacyl-[acyl-carrier-protein] synthase family protein [Bacillus cereus]|nr:beta-ketoacyl-[acyl-carrier-protein] synthase family protein [Bacillus cereus]